VWLVHGLPSGHPEAKSEDKIPIGPPWIEGTVPGVPAVVIKADSVADAYRLRGELRRNGTTALFPAEVLLDLYSTLGDARDLLAMVSVATQGLVIAAVLLAVFAVLAARRQQLAVLRALGASRGYLFLTVWLQVMVMIAAGAVIGLGLGWAGAGFVSRLFETKTGLVLEPGIGGPELFMVAALLGVGALLAAIPATIGYRQPVAEGLRG
jgi:putative ABC transport system permease protein